VADMETSHIYEIAHRCGVRAVSLVLVSDEPPGMPFWETDLSSLARHISNVPGFLCRWLDHGSF
jgi:purine-nucleoside phosphorylase